MVAVVRRHRRGAVGLVDVRPRYRFAAQKRAIYNLTRTFVNVVEPAGPSGGSQNNLHRHNVRIATASRIPAYGASGANILQPDLRIGLVSETLRGERGVIPKEA